MMNVYIVLYYFFSWVTITIIFLNGHGKIIGMKYFQNKTVQEKLFPVSSQIPGVANPLQAILKKELLAFEDKSGAVARA